MQILKCFPLVLCLTASAAQPANDDFAGVGVELRADGQNIVVNRILPDTPAAIRKGIQVGDRIIAVAQAQDPAVEVTNIMQTAHALRGPKGTTVRLTIVPAGEDDSHVQVVSFVRGEVKDLWGDGVLLGTGTAPDIEMIDLANRMPERLSSYAGKIVVLEVWASWCGPCQSRMAELQTYTGKYSDWQTNVVLIAASIDDSAEIATKHLKAKGWNQTHNVLVEIRALRAYHVEGIPTVYVIGRQGEIVAVNPRDLSRAVNNELEEKPVTDAR